MSGQSVSATIFSDQSPVDGSHFWKCSCGWNLRVTRREQIEDPMAVQSAHWEAVAHQKEHADD